MPATGPCMRAALVLRAWGPTHPGTNGFISSWGANLSGTAPERTSA